MRITGQIGGLRRQLERQRGGMSVRTLMANYGEADHPDPAVHAHEPRVCRAVLPCTCRPVRHGRLRRGVADQRRRRGGCDGARPIRGGSRRQQTDATDPVRRRRARARRRRGVPAQGRSGRGVHPERMCPGPGARASGSPGTTAARTSRSSRSATSTTTTAACPRSPPRYLGTAAGIGRLRHLAGAGRRHVRTQLDAVELCEPTGSRPRRSFRRCSSGSGPRLRWRRPSGSSPSTRSSETSSRTCCVIAAMTGSCSRWTSLTGCSSRTSRTSRATSATSSSSRWRSARTKRASCR